MSTDGVGRMGRRAVDRDEGQDAPHSAGAPMLRTENASAGRPRVREARLYVSALGVYDAYVNGRHVTVPQDGGTTTELLPPGSTNYDARVNYLTYDVTDLVTREPHVTLAAVLGNGWYNGRISDEQHLLLRGRQRPGPQGQAADPLRRRLVADRRHRAGRRLEGHGHRPLPRRRHLRRPDLRRPQGAARLDGARLRRLRLVGRGASRLRPPGSPDARLVAYPGEIGPADARWDRRPQSITVATGVTGQDGSPSGGAASSWTPPGRSPIPPRPPPPLSPCSPGETAVIDLGQNMVGVPRYTLRGPAGAQVELPVRRDAQRRQRRRGRPRGLRLPGQPPHRQGHQHVHPQGRPARRDPPGLPDLLRLPLRLRHHDRTPSPSPA